MPKLSGATVYRTGETKGAFGIETRDVEMYAAGHSVSFDFRIASAGGGKTAARLEITEQDVPAVLEQILIALGDKAAAEMARLIQVYLQNGRPTAVME